jgi:hypothetical protein
MPSTASATPARPSSSPAADASAHRAEEGITANRWVPLAEALAMSTTGEVTDGETIAALAMAQAKLSSIQ